MNARAEFAGRFPLIYRLLTEQRTRFLGWMAVLFIGVIAFEYARLIAVAPDRVIAKGSMVGGDYIVFRDAAMAAVGPEPAWIYRPDSLRSSLQAQYPKGGEMTVSWQYPPAMFLLVSPIAPFGYMSGYLVWESLLLVVFLGAAALLGVRGSALLFVLASPALVQSVITGQTGMWTGALLAVGGYFAASRPMLAGLAIGLLTTKPQFGLLIPLALLAGRHWQTIGWATATTIALQLVAVAIFGVDVFEGFVAAVRFHAAELVARGYPFGKLLSPFGAGRVLGLSNDAAMSVQFAVSISLAAWVAWVWIREQDARLRCAALAVAAPLVTPYALYYEAILLALPMALLATHAVERGWRRGEFASLVLLWFMPLILPGSDDPVSSPWGFIFSFLAFAIVFRRVHLARRACHEAGAMKKI